MSESSERYVKRALTAEEAGEVGEDNSAGRGRISERQTVHMRYLRIAVVISTFVSDGTRRRERSWSILFALKSPLRV